MTSRIINHHGNVEEVSDHEFSQADKIRALTAFVKAVDKAIVTALGSRPGNAYGERIACIRADEMDEPEMVRPIQRARDRLVEVGLLEPIK